MIKLQEEGIYCGFTIQVDTLCHKIPNFIEKATKAGAKRIFIGLETSTPRISSPPRSGKTRSPNIASCCRSGAPMARSPSPATSSASPPTRKKSILRDIEIIKRELPLDILEFFFLTPLPGSEDHKKLC